MAWSLENANSGRPAANKIAHLIVAYTRGQGLDIGCSRQRAWPHFIGVETPKFFPNSDASIKAEFDKLAMFADGSMDFVFSSFTLHYLTAEKVSASLKEWARIIKKDGYLVLYVPKGNELPLQNEPGYDANIKGLLKVGSLEKLLQTTTECGWTQVECEDRSIKETEFGLFEVYKKRDDGAFVKDLWQRNPEGKKRAMVIRYGALGDHIIAASILPGLKQQGYHITYHTVPVGQQVLLHNPNIDEWLIEDKDQVPNAELGPFWEALRLEGRYDKIINLCESMEVALLAVPGRIQHGFSHEARHKLLNINYLEYIHDIASVPYEFHQKFHVSEAEKKWALEQVDNVGAPVVAWAINGSSHHKVYPYVQVVAAWLLERTTAHIFIMAGEDGKILQDGIVAELTKSGVDLSRVHCMAGKWTVRQSMSFAQYADVVVGPETGLLNAVAFENNRKVIYLSHSSQENLTKHWKNTAVLEAPKSLCPCAQACHMLHYGWDHCHKVEKTQAALCASSIAPEDVFREIALGLGAQKVVPLIVREATG